MRHAQFCSVTESDVSLPISYSRIRDKPATARRRVAIHPLHFLPSTFAARRASRSTIYYLPPTDFLAAFRIFHSAFLSRHSIHFSPAILLFRQHVAKLLQVALGSGLGRHKFLRCGSPRNCAPVRAICAPACRPPPRPLKAERLMAERSKAKSFIFLL